MTNNLTLLYVEDDETVRENFTEIFRDYFKNVITAENGKIAYELYEKNSIDVAILDISLPLMSGLNLASKIRETDKNIELIILSAYSDREKLLHAVNLQLFTYLVKPIGHKELDKVLQELINKLNPNEPIGLLGGYTLYKTTEVLSFQDKHIKITKNEIKVITLLCDNATRYLKPCEIYELLFNKIGSGECNNIVQLISRLKKKFIKLGFSKDFFIQSNYGLGYKIILS